MKIFNSLLIAYIKDMARDRMTLFWFLVFPVLFIFIFGSIFGGSQEDIVFNVGLVADEGKVLGTMVEQAFAHVPIFNMYKGNEEEEMAALERKERHMVVAILPADTFMESAEVLVYYDPGERLSAQALLGAVNRVFFEIERALTDVPNLFTVKPMAMGSTELKDIDYILPGILAMSIMQLGIFASLQFVGFRQNKVLKRLGATPAPKSSVLGSQIVVRLIISMFQTLVILLVGHLVYKVTVVGNLFVIVGLVLLGTLLFTALGFFVSSFAKTVESANVLAQIVQFPLMFLSGIFFPIDFMPKFLQPVLKIIPLSYFGDLLRHVITGFPLTFPPGRSLGIMAVWCVVSSALALKFFRWQYD